MFHGPEFVVIVYDKHGKHRLNIFCYRFLDSGKPWSSVSRRSARCLEPNIPYVYAIRGIKNQTNRPCAPRRLKSNCQCERIFVNWSLSQILQYWTTTHCFNRRGATQVLRRLRIFRRRINSMNQRIGCSPMFWL